jgi:hypothetical protein
LTYRTWSFQPIVYSPLAQLRSCNTFQLEINKTLLPIFVSGIEARWSTTACAHIAVSMNRSLATLATSPDLSSKTLEIACFGR